MSNWQLIEGSRLSGKISLIVIAWVTTVQYLKYISEGNLGPWTLIGDAGLARLDELGLRAGKSEVRCLNGGT